MTRSRHILPPRTWWTEEQEMFLRDWYPHVCSRTLAEALGSPVKRLLAKAANMGLRKSPELVAELAQRPDHGGRRTQFSPGKIPWNKGIPWVAGGRSADTRFKPGRTPEENSNYRPIGTLRINADGLLQRKVTDDQRIRSANRWVGVHRLVWEAEHGPVPAGHAVAFRPGRKTTDPDKITADALELVTRAELMARNTVHRLPRDLAQAVQLMGALHRRINDRQRKETA